MPPEVQNKIDRASLQELRGLVKVNLSPVDRVKLKKRLQEETERSGREADWQLGVAKINQGAGEIFNMLAEVLPKAAVGLVATIFVANPVAAGVMTLGLLARAVIAGTVLISHSRLEKLTYDVINKGADYKKAAELYLGGLKDDFFEASTIIASAKVGRDILTITENMPGISVGGQAIATGVGSDFTSTTLHGVKNIFENGLEALPEVMRQLVVSPLRGATNGLVGSGFNQLYLSALTPGSFSKLITAELFANSAIGVASDMSASEKDLSSITWKEVGQSILNNVPRLVIQHGLQGTLPKLQKYPKTRSDYANNQGNLQLVIPNQFRVDPLYSRIIENIYLRTRYHNKPITILLDLDETIGLSPKYGEPLQLRPGIQDFMQYLKSNFGNRIKLGIMTGRGQNRGLATLNEPDLGNLIKQGLISKDEVHFGLVGADKAKFISLRLREGRSDYLLVDDDIESCKGIPGNSLWVDRSIVASSRMNPEGRLILNPASIAKWLDQFDPSDRPIAARLLVHVDFYGPDQLRLQLGGLNQKLSEFGLSPENTMYGTIGRAKSGQAVGYFFRQANGLGFTPRLDNQIVDRFIDFGELRSGNFRPISPNLVLLDDYLVTGYQLSNTLPLIQDGLRKFQTVVVAPTFYSQEGMSKIQNAHGIKVIGGSQIKTLEDVPRTVREDIIGLQKKYSDRANPLNGGGKGDGITGTFLNAPANIVPLLGSFGQGRWFPLIPRLSATRPDLDVLRIK